MSSIAILMGLWAAFLVPETNRVPIERLQAAFSRHWLWRRFFPRADEESAGEDAALAGRDQDGRVRLVWSGGCAGAGARAVASTQGVLTATAQRVRARAPGAPQRLATQSAGGGSRAL
jgi:hypothetical protein